MRRFEFGQDADIETGRLAHLAQQAVKDAAAQAGMLRGNSTRARREVGDRAVTGRVGADFRGDMGRFIGGFAVFDGFRPVAWVINR